MNFTDYFSANNDANITLMFGVFLMFGVLGGILANRIKWMPTITAFMLLGFMIGPYGLGLVSKEMLTKSAVVIDVALGLILYKLGTMLHPMAMLRSRRLAALALFEGVLSYGAVFVGATFLGVDRIAAALIAAISVSSSPAVLVHVAEELHAKGIVSDRAKSLVAINNLVAFVLFSVALPFGMATADSSLMMFIGVPVYRLAGATLVGIGVAWLAARIAGMLREEDNHYRFAIVIGAVMLVLGVCNALNMSALFAPLVLGIAIRWFETRKNNLSRIALGEGGDLFFIVLFVMAGAKINLSALVALGFVPFAIALLRTAGKVGGIFTASYLQSITMRQAFSTSLMLVPMAGMAIGLVSTATLLVPSISAEIGTIVFAMVAIFETVGPFLVTYAIKLSGEDGKALPADADEAEPNL